MKRSLKIFVLLALVTILTIPSIFAADLQSYGNQVRVGNVDSDDIIFNVDVKWGDLIFDFSKQENGSYAWVPQSNESNYISVTNKSNVVINSKVDFIPNIENLEGYVDMDSSSKFSNYYPLLTEEPADFASGEYYVRDEENNFTLKEASDTFELNKYYGIGFGAGPIDNNNGNINPVTVNDGNVELFGVTYCFRLSGGNVSQIKPGIIAGTISVTIQ